MVQFDNQYRQIKVKIVYYGPALGGKTTCLQHIHRVVDPERRTKLYSLNTASDRTLFFDLLALDLGRIRGYRLTLQLYTVPGQVQYNATRRAVLAGADGVVFVADSQVAQREANRESLENLWQNLRANGLDPRAVPLVLQYNKRDLEPILTVDQLDSDLNPGGLPAFPSVAIRGEGVMEAFAEIARRTLEAVADKLGVGSRPQVREALRRQVDAALGPYVGTAPPAAGTAGAADEPATDQVVRSTAPVTSGPLPDEELVQEAVRANVAMTDLNARMDTLRGALERKVRALAAVAEFGRRAGTLRDPEAVLRQLATDAVPALGATAATVASCRGQPLAVAATHGLERDPLLAATDGTGEKLAASLLEVGGPLLLVPEPGAERDEAVSLAMEVVEAAGYGSAVLAPLEARGEIVGLLAVYRQRGRRPFEEDELNVAAVMAATAAFAFDDALGWRRLEELNRGLEAQVAERTRELRETLEEVRRLAASLEEKHAMLEQAYRELAELDRLKAELITRISHELKTPVTSLVTAARILGRYRDAPPEKGARFVEIVRSEAEKLAEMIEGVVHASLLAGEGTLEVREVAAEELLKRAVAPLRDLAAARSVRLHVKISAGLDTVRCDPEAMTASLQAVLKNAIQFNVEGGEVTVEVRRVRSAAGRAVRFVVRDTGVGIPENELPHVFEPFWQGGNVLTGKPRGLGLGLAVARRAVERHGGTVAVTSTVGEGTEVVLELPAPAEDA